MRAGMVPAGGSCGPLRLIGVLPLLLALAWWLGGASLAQEAPPHTASPGPRSAGQPARPPAAELRAGLEDVLRRREYRQALSEDAAAEMQRRLLARVARALARLLAPLGALQQTNKSLFYTLVTGLSLLLLVLVAHIVLTIRAGLRATRKVRQREPSSRPEPGDTDPQRLRRRAAQQAAAGDFLGALRTCYLALVRHLDRVELLHYDATRTNWEYVAQVRNVPEATAVLRPFSALLDRKVYGGELATEADYAAGRDWLEDGLRLGEVVS